MSNKIADTFNEFGTPVTLFACLGCESTFTVCPAVEDKHLDQWSGCLGRGCSTYDDSRDADKMFDEGKVRRVGDRSCFTVIAGSKDTPQ
ncbi:hypothetical protein [Brevundimonas sp.]|uniref:hypothetical protein n=1 Tax=Brevundimonas sp. TaxID=1871086 RepID=UPI0028A735FD|nr:hypothetical protein [Brevundimonas sp.]